MAPRYVHWNLICILGLLSCRTSQNLTHPTSTGAPSSASAISPSSDTTTCVAFLSLAAPTQEELRWQPLNDATVPFSTRTYGTHTAL